MGTVARSRAEILEQEIQTYQALDLIECRRSAVAFMGRHCTIEEPNGKVIPLKMWGFQRDIVREASKHRVLIVLKARRLGLSWIALAYALWMAMFNPGIRILILCKNERDASELLDRIRRMRDRMVKDDKHRHIFRGVKKTDGTERDTVTLLDIGDSTIRCLVGTPGAARSETAGFVLCDEFAFQGRAGEIWRGLLPTIEGGVDHEATDGRVLEELAKEADDVVVTEGSNDRYRELYDKYAPEYDTGGRVWIVSTGDGNENEFANQWERAQTGESGIYPIFIPWHKRPGRDEAWKAKQIELLGDEDRFRVEYPELPEDAFVAADATYVYVKAHINAAEKLGRKFDALPFRERLKLCSGGKQIGGIDWGDYASFGLLAFPLERGGIYITREHTASQEEPGEFTTKYLKLADIDNAVDLYEVAFDAAGQSAMRTFRTTARSVPKYRRLKTHEVSFGRYKSESMSYLRALFKRVGDGKETRVIAISPRCVNLLRQLRAYEQDPDTGKVQKIHDHGPDAAVALVKKTAQQHRESLTAEEARRG